VKYSLRLRSTAEEEIASIALWYESESPGLGSQFLDKIDQSLERISENPLQYLAISKRLRRALVKRFPYIIFFTIIEEEILIVGCRYAGQNPERWLSL
jgi:plasmid stabilization system protein ParE